jgi:hypothetical protein
MTMVKQSRRAKPRPSESLPATLEQAHVWIGAREPAAPASREAEKAWRELAASVYRQVAATDPKWADRAREWARAEEETAFRLGAQIAVSKAMGYYLGADMSSEATDVPPVGQVDL